MTTFSDDNMAVADVYAESLLAVADAKGTTEDVGAEFADLVAYVDRDESFASFLVSASVDEDARRGSLEKLFRGKMSDLLLNTLQVLNNRGRLHLIRQVARAVELRMEALHHQQEVLVETAMPLSDDLKTQIKQVVSERIGQEALLIEEVRPELIGGVVIHIGDLQIDGSVVSRLGRLRRRLKERATVEIHRAGQFVTE